MSKENTSIGIGAFDNCPLIENKPDYPSGTVPEETIIPMPYEPPVVSAKEPDALPTVSTSFNNEIVKVKLSTGREITIRRSVKEFLDAYEDFMDSYMDALIKVSDGDFSGYLSFTEQAIAFAKQAEDLEDDLTEDEALYYTEVMLRVSLKMY